MGTKDDDYTPMLRQPSSVRSFKKTIGENRTTSSSVRKRINNISSIEDNFRDNSHTSDYDKVWNDGKSIVLRISLPLEKKEEEEERSKSNGDVRNDRILSSNDKDYSEIIEHRESRKINTIRATVSKPDLTYGEFRALGCGNEGFVNDDIRRILWPALLGIGEEDLIPVHGLKTVHNLIQNEVYQQILKDVVRSASHFPKQSTDDEIANFENEMTQMICWVLERHKKLNYYQGYNDVAATVLMVMGLERGIYVLEKISLEYLERFMESTMEKVNQELFFIFALLERVHPTLLQHLENVELFPHFALAEYTTWYAHKYSEHRKLLHRLFDYFLCSPKLMPLYLSTVIVAHRASEIFNTTPDMGHTHKVLCTLPEDLPFETLLIEAKKLYNKYPPESIKNDVKDYDTKRRRKEQEWKIIAENNRKERERRNRLRQVAIPNQQRGLPYRVGSYRTIAVVTVLALGIYAFLKTSTGID